MVKLRTFHTQKTTPTQKQKIFETNKKDLQVIVLISKFIYIWYFLFNKSSCYFLMGKHSTGT